MVVHNPRSGEQGEKGVEGGETTFVGNGFTFAGPKLQSCAAIGVENKARLLTFSEAAPHGWVVAPIAKGSATKIRLTSLIISPTQTRVDMVNPAGEPTNVILQFLAKAI